MVFYDPYGPLTCRGQSDRGTLSPGPDWGTFSPGLHAVDNLTRGLLVLVLTGGLLVLARLLVLTST